MRLDLHLNYRPSLCCRTSAQMFSHVVLGVSDFERAFQFYSAIAKELGLVPKFKDVRAENAGWMPSSSDRPLLLIGKPFDGQPHCAGKGQMIGFLAQNRGVVDRAYFAAGSMGGLCEGPPGLRSHYHPTFYGAYFWDLDGNKICVCCYK